MKDCKGLVALPRVLYVVAPSQVVRPVVLLVPINVIATEAHGTLTMKGTTDQAMNPCPPCEGCGSAVRTHTQVSIVDIGLDDPPELYVPHPSETAHLPCGDIRCFPNLIH